MPDEQESQHSNLRSLMREFFYEQLNRRTASHCCPISPGGIPLSGGDVVVVLSGGEIHLHGMIGRLWTAGQLQLTDAALCFPPHVQ